jgi:hypothetical protein
MAGWATVVGAAPFLLASMQSSTAPAQGPLQPVLAYEAALPRGSPPVCVSLSPRGTALDEAREQIRSMRATQPGNPRDASRRRQYLNDHEHRQYDWRLPRPLGGHQLPPPLDAAQGAMLSAAIQPLVSGGPVVVGQAELGPIPAPLRAGVSPGCGARLTLTAPVVSGNLAFVETSYDCGGLCGNGWLYALRHEHGQWRLLAIAFTWIS